MDLSKLPEGSEAGQPYSWKTFVICGATGRFIVETYINYRQLRILRRWNVQNKDESRIWDVKRTRFRTFSSFCSMLQVVLLTGLDIVPALWRFAVETEAWLLEDTDHSRLVLSQDFDRSAIFMIYCFLAFLLINLPTYVYRTQVLKERVIRDYYYGRKNHNWVVRSVVGGRPVNAVLFVTGFCVMEFKILKVNFDKVYVLTTAVSQLLSFILIPLLTQPNRKTLSIMEPGPTRNAIEELTGAAKFPLKNTYIIDDQHRLHVEVFGLPRRKYIAIPKTMMEESDTDDIIGVVAHAMGSWKYSNGFRLFCLGQMYWILTWTYLTIFMNERTNYEAFGFKGEYPRIAAFVIFTFGFAPLLAAVLGFNISYLGRKSDFIADKYAVELGYASTLVHTLLKKQSADSSESIDWVYSMYHNPVPTVSERLAELEKLKEEKGAKEEGLISLSGDEKK